MKKKKGRKIILGIVALLIGLIVLNYLGLLKFESKPYSMIPIVNFPIETTSPYPCPLDVTQCKVQGNIECTQGGLQPSVKFRTNVLNANYNSYGSDGKSPWIAYRISDVLTSFIYFEERVLPVNNFGLTPTENLKDGSSLYFSSGKIYITKHEIINNGIPSTAHKCAITYSGGACSCSGSCAEIFDSGLCPSNYNDCGPISYSDGEKFYVFNVGTGADTTTTPKEPYTSSNCGGMTPCQELTIGSINIYNCNGLFETYNTNGNLFYSESINYQSASPGNKSSNPQIIYPGWKAKLTSTSASNSHLYYGTYEEKEECSAGNTGKCLLPDSYGNSNGFYNCENGILNRNNITWCDTSNGYYCNEGLCQVPFQTKEIFITDSSGNIKTGFNKNEGMKISFRLIGKAGTPLYNAKSGTVRFEFYKLGDSIPKTNVVREGYDFSSGQTVSLSIDNPASDGDLGLYYLVAFVTYDSSKPSIKLGLENPNQPTYQVSIGSSVSCSIQLQTSITDITTSKLLTNVPILVKLNPTIGGVGSPVLSKTVKVYMNKGTSKEQSVTLDIPSSEGSSGGAYTYVYNFVTDQPGDLYAKADISDSGVPATCYSTAKVEDMTITTSQYNIGGSCLPSGPHTFFFETLDSLNRQAQVTSTLCVKKPGSGTYCEPINDLVQQVPGGKIGQTQFTYDLVKNVGETAQYTFQMKTHSNEFNRDYEVPDINIEVKDSCVPVECRTTKECQVSKGDTYMCVNGSCVNPSPNWLLYIGIGVVVIILSVAVYFIVRSVTKPKTEVYTGLEGL